MNRLHMRQLALGSCNKGSRTEAPLFDSVLKPPPLLFQAPNQRKPGITLP